jgi:hypothetical protein
MTDAEIAFWLILMGCVEMVAIFVAVFYVFLHDKGLHQVQKAGFAFMVFGLVVQLVRSTHYLLHGSYPVDVHFPLWITKDLGASILIYYYAFIHQRSTK